MSASLLAVPAVMAAYSPSVQFTGGKIVVSGRVVDAHDGRPLAGAQVEIWQADARGVRTEHTHEVVTADGDGRYFAALKGNAQRLHYRVSHRGYTAKVTQLHTDARQRSVTLTRDDAGATRAAFEMTLTPRKALASAAPDYVAL
ncbi:MAG TPA: carboxypeptidase regulatory-like domain-containing protein [Burkholderiales bacterium]|nr:carboxypeptidase regulatory-like domain-containing protein [Burkholderiales bacterium]